MGFMNICISRENKGTERGNQGVGWDMSIPLKLFLTKTEADVCFRRRPRSIELISQCEFSFKKYHFPSFTKSYPSTKLISTLSAILMRSLRTTDRG